MQKISVIVPTYNEEKYVRKCLTSLFNQSHKPIEIIVVDDSSDNTWEILAEFPTRYKQIFFRRFRTQHKGPATARNLGAHMAKGDILAFVDGDMEFDTNYLAKLVVPIERGEALATFTKEEYVANLENVWSRCWSINSYLPLNRRLPVETKEWGTTFRAIRRDAFNKTRGYKDVGYGEDITVLSQLKGVHAKAASGAICYHYNPSSLLEVFIQARWMGKGVHISYTIRSVLIYSLPNSLRSAIWQSFKHKNFPFLIFKLVFDFGILFGLLERMLGRSYVK